MKKYFFIFFNKHNFSHACLLLFFSIDLSAIEFIYPIIAQLPDGTSMVMHQSSPYDILLATYDFKSNKVSRSFLSSQFCPKKVYLLPDGTGFSFFDNGMLKVQAFLKRHPRTIEILYPLSCFQDIEWESPYIFYINALHKKQNALFRVNLSAHDAAIDFMIFSSNSDFLCPQKRGSGLFFIDRSSDKSKTEYHFSCVNFDSNLDSRKEKLKNKKNLSKAKEYFSQSEYLKSVKCCDLENIKILIDFENQPIISLTMDSCFEGSAIGYDNNIKTSEEALVFFYYFLYKNNNGDWQKKLFFSFSLPKNLFLGDGESQLIESIFPLLPKKIDNIIYYSSLIGQNVNLFSFSPETGASKQLTFAQQLNEHYFCPIIVGGNLYCGQSLIDSNQKIDLYCIPK